MKVWIARDVTDNIVPGLIIYSSYPVLGMDGMFLSIARWVRIDSSQFPEIKPGECWEAEITLKQKDGKEAQ